MKLYSYYRSSASYRVRIALNLKEVEFEQQAVHLLKDGGQQHSESYRRLNPQSLVPSLEEGDGSLTQSLAIIEYLDEVYPEPALLPQDPWQKAQVRAFALAIACDIQPIANLRVQKYLKDHLKIDRSHTQEWLSHWISSGLKAMEKILKRNAEVYEELSAKKNEEGAGGFCFGDTPTLADIVLIPQMYNAHRFNIETTPFRRLEAIYNHCLELPAFHRSAPENQPDAENL